MSWSPLYRMVMLKGMPSQILTMMTAISATLVLVSHGTAGRLTA